MLLKIFKEPLLHFLLIGAGLFLLNGYGNSPAVLPAGQADNQSTRIVVTDIDIDQLVETFGKTWQREPTQKEKNGLVETFIRDEIYYREARAMGLDRQDPVIRRRMRQQMEFIFEDITSQVEPTETELTTYMEDNRERYMLAPQFAFSHIYLGEHQTGENAEKEAQHIYARLEAGADPTSLGKPFLQGSEVAMSPLWQIKSMFGDTFTSHLLELTPDQWEGPIQSPYGLHLVRVTSRKESRLPDLNEVRDTVKRDLMAKRQQKLKDEAYAVLRQKYKVIIEKPTDLALNEQERNAMKTVN